MTDPLVDWSAVDTVLLDMDGTLLDLRFDNHFWLEHVPLRYAERHGLPYEESRTRLLGRYAAVAGTLDWYCADYWTRELGLDILRLKEEVAHLIAVHPNVVPFLERLRATGRRAVLVTNAHHGSLALKMARTGLRARFDAIFCSHDLGVPKEHAEFWPRLRAVEPFDPARTLLVDDSLPVLRAARAAGIGQTLAVLRPDSAGPDKAGGEFAALADFSAMMPPGGSAGVSDGARADAALAESEERLRLALECGGQGLYDLDMSSGRVLVNAEFARMLGHSPEGFTFSFGDWIAALHPDDRERAVAAYEDYAAGRSPEYRTEFRMRTAGGGWKWILSAGRIVARDAGGRPLRMLGTHTDVSALKEAQERVERLARFYAALSGANDAVMRAGDEASMLRRVSRVLVEAGGFRMAWIGLLDEASGMVRAVASHGAPEDAVGAIEISLDPASPKGRGPTACAIREDRLQLCNDYMSDPRTAAWRSIGERLGIGASAAVPIRRGGRVVGALNVYAGTAGFFDEEISRLFEEMAANVSRALDAFERSRLLARANAELGEARDRLQAMFSAAPVAIVVIDPEGRVLNWNPNAERLFGWREDEVLGRPLPIVPEAERPAFDGVRERTLRGNSISGLEIRRLRRDGTLLDVSLSTAPLRDSEGRAVAVLGMLIDVTDRKRAEASLRESEERLRLALTAARQGLYDLNVQTGQARVSPEYATMLGYDPGTFVETNAAWIERLHPDDLERVAAAYRDYVAGRLPEYRVEFRQRTRDGRWRWVLSMGSIVERDAGGSPLRMLGTHTDIDDRRRAEERVREARNRLQALSNRLIQVQEDERRRIARELHDEIGQSLTAIKLHLQIARRRPDRAAAQVDECLEIADGALRHCRDLSLDLRPPQLDDLGLAAAIRWQLDRQARAAGWHPRFRGEDELPRLQPAAEIGCFRVAQEALTNAARHAHASEVSVELQSRDGAVWLTVRDDGAGFDPDEARRRAVAGGSAGMLGMQERVTLAGGQLEIRSKPGAGTEVVACFPLDAPGGADAAGGVR